MIRRNYISLVDKVGKVMEEEEDEEEVEDLFDEDEIDDVFDEILHEIFDDEESDEASQEKKKLEFLFDLDEDFLFQIFDHLKLADLCIMADVSKYSRAITRCYFLLNYGDFDFDWLLKDNDEFDLKEAEKIFELFGDLIITLIISAQHFNDETQRNIFRMVNKYCTGTLEQLIVEHLNMDSDAINELVPLMDDLLDSDFVHCDVFDKKTGCFELTLQAHLFVLIPEMKVGSVHCCAKETHASR